MILADKIINERKKNGWSQEELAEQLSVSRQSVSKWEGGQAIPDLQKILKMAELFGVSTDYLLKDEMEPEEYKAEIIPVVAQSDIDTRKVSMDEASEYLHIIKKNNGLYSNAVSICILSPVVLIFLVGLSDEKIWGITEALASGIGVITLLLMVAAAVGMFLIVGAKENPYEFLEKVAIETEYGVSGIVKEKKKAFETTRMTATVVGVIMCILSAIPLLVSALFEAKDYIVTSMVCVLLGIVSVAVNLFVRVGRINGSYEKLLQENEYSVKEKQANKVISKVSGIYWSIIVAIYLGWSFYTNRWEFTWLVWPVAAMIYGAVNMVMRMVLKVDD